MRDRIRDSEVCGGGDGRLPRTEAIILWTLGLVDSNVLKVQFMCLLQSQLIGPIA